MNTKQVPILITLLGALVACVLTVLQGVEFSVFFFRFLIAVLVFGVIGTAVKILLDVEFNPKPEEVMEGEEGEGELLEGEEGALEGEAGDSELGEDEQGNSEKEDE